MSAGDDRNPILRKDSTGEHGHAPGNRGSSNAKANPRPSEELPNVAVVVHEEIETKNNYDSLRGTL